MAAVTGVEGTQANQWFYVSHSFAPKSITQCLPSTWIFLC